MKFYCILISDEKSKQLKFRVTSSYIREAIVHLVTAVVILVLANVGLNAPMAIKQSTSTPQTSTETMNHNYNGFHRARP